MTDRLFSVEEYAAKARQAVAEGIVMLRNEDGALPLAKGTKIALFGRGQFNYYKGGTGSGGMVNTRYVTGIAEALEQSEEYELNRRVKEAYLEWLADHPFNRGIGWAQEPWFQEEMPLSEELARQAAEESDAAVIIIARTAGEDKDNVEGPGSYLLTDTEEKLLETVCSAFRRTVVLLNVGNLIDMKWVEKYAPSAVLYVWQGGQEGGNGVLDVISGKVSPSGRLTDTVARDLHDYPAAEWYGDPKRNFYAEDIYVGYRYFSTFAPEKVLYPFGYGLSYTSFSIETELAGLPPVFYRGIMLEKHTLKIRARVKNTGACSGKAVVQVYCQAPQGLLGKPARVLCGFAKSSCLAPGEMQELTVGAPWTLLASYDDSGVTGNRSCYVLEAGEYVFYAGENVRDAKPAGRLMLPQMVVIRQLEEAMAPVTAFSHLRPGEKNTDGTYAPAWEETHLRTVDPAQRRLERLPKEAPYTGDQGFRLSDVAAGLATMEQFLGQLSDEELCCAVRGEGMCSPKVTPGTAGAFGGLTESLAGYGLPAACCADGPSGIRMDCGTVAFSMPIGTCLACTFNEELVEELYQWEGMELRKNQIDTLLGPGMNIHRYPLNGRNFEYFSEDPLVTGKMAAAQLRGMQKYGVTGTIKHFACNNQEDHRYTAEAVVSERALREIYLKGFEIAVKEGEARSIMSTYGPMNGFWTSSSYDLLTTILRGEWGYQGIVMSDWWAMGNEEGGAPAIQNTGAMVRSQNDLYMVTEDALTNANGDNSLESLVSGTVTRGEFQRSVANICRFLLASPAWLRKQGIETELDAQLRQCAEEEDDMGDGPVIPVSVDVIGEADPALIDTSMGKNNILQVTPREKGRYRLEMTCRISPDTVGAAQMPVSVFQDRKLAKTITLTGLDRDWEERIVELPDPVEKDSFHVKLFFGQSGVEISRICIVRSNP